VVDTLGAQAVGHRGDAVGVTDVSQARLTLQGGELVDDHLRLGLGHGTGHRVGIERLRHNRPSAQSPQHVAPGRRASHADHIVAGGGQLADELSADRTSRSGDEHFHGCLLRNHLSGDHPGGHI
jgi:hypothetical protein